MSKWLAQVEIEIRTVISEPVTKVGTGNVHLVPFLSAGRSGHNEGEEGVFDIAMAPCVLVSSCAMLNVKEVYAQFDPSILETDWMLPAPKA